MVGPISPPRRPFPPPPSSPRPPPLRDEMVGDPQETLGEMRVRVRDFGQSATQDIWMGPLLADGQRNGPGSLERTGGIVTTGQDSIGGDWKGTA